MYLPVVLGGDSCDLVIGPFTGFDAFDVCVGFGADEDFAASEAFDASKEALTIEAFADKEEIDATAVLRPAMILEASDFFGPADIVAY